MNKTVNIFRSIAQWWKDRSSSASGDQYRSACALLIKQGFISASHSDDGGETVTFDYTPAGEELRRHLRRLFDIPAVDPMSLELVDIANLVRFIVLTPPPDLLLARGFVRSSLSDDRTKTVTADYTPAGEELRRHLRQLFYNPMSHDLQGIVWPVITILMTPPTNEVS